jgi:hypothetical protein
MHVSSCSTSPTRTPRSLASPFSIAATKVAKRAGCGSDGTVDVSLLASMVLTPTPGLLVSQHSRIAPVIAPVDALVSALASRCWGQDADAVAEVARP